MLIDVFKLGGAESENDVFLQKFAVQLHERANPCILVHGGGREIAKLQNLMGITPQYVAGLRITDAQTIRLADMVLAGAVNKRIVRMLNQAGVPALGLSGADLNLLRAKKIDLGEEAGDTDPGFVGTITEVNTRFLSQLLATGVFPVIAPVAFGYDGQAYNVNADSAAVAVAKAMNAATLSFLTDVPGVMDQGRVLSSLTIDQAHHAVDTGVITDGMIPKVRAAALGVNEGIPKVLIGRAEAGTLVCP